MKRLLLTTFLLVISISASSKNNYSEPTFCEWIEAAAIAVTQNRDNGIEEYDLIGKYLSAGTSYEEQSIIIRLIDRVYRTDISQGEIAFIEKQECEIAFVS